MTQDEARGILLAAIMEADHAIKRGEVDFGTAAVGLDVWAQAMLETHHVQDALTHLKDAPLPERRAIVTELWTMTEADGRLHPAELNLILSFEAALGVQARPTAN